MTEDQAEQHAAKLAELRKGMRKCRLCDVWVQRTPKGTIDDGMAEHQKIVHGIHR